MLCHLDKSLKYPWNHMPTSSTLVVGPFVPTISQHDKIDNANYAKLLPPSQYNLLSQATHLLKTLIIDD